MGLVGELVVSGHYWRGRVVHEPPHFFVCQPAHGGFVHDADESGRACYHEAGHLHFVAFHHPRGFLRGEFTWIFTHDR